MTAWKIKVGDLRVIKSEQAYRRLIAKRLCFLGILIFLVFCSALIDIFTGPSGMSPWKLLRILFGIQTGSPGEQVIVWDIRFPYALMAIFVGSTLGLSGGEMQTILNNPLASPFTLGVSAAASFGASLAIILGWSVSGIAPEWIISVDAFIFAMSSAFLLDIIARIKGSNANAVILFGIALVFTFHALVSLMQFIANEDALQDLVFWTMGSLTRANWAKLGFLFTALVIILPMSLRASWKLTALRMGEERAASFGIDIRRTRVNSLIRISILSALAVSFVGIIGFVGLVAPHIARKLMGEDHRFYLLGSALTGGLIMSAASIAAKTIIPGIVIPVGIVTALVGIPFFLAIVLRRRAI